MVDQNEQQSPELPTDQTEKRSLKRSRPSGEHPAVQAYRKKLDSVDVGVTAATTELDRALQQFLTDLKTPVPPKPDPEPDPEPTS